MGSFLFRSLFPEQMHDYGAVLAGLGLVDGELTGTVITELFAHAFAIYKSQAVAEHATPVPVAHNSVTFAIFPERFAGEFSAHAVRKKATTFDNLTVLPKFLIQ